MLNSCNDTALNTRICQLRDYFYFLMKKRYKKGISLCLLYDRYTLFRGRCCFSFMNESFLYNGWHAKFLIGDPLLANNLQVDFKLSASCYEWLLKASDEKY